VHFEIAPRELSEHCKHMLEVVFEYVGVEFAGHVECSHRATCLRAPDATLSREEISPADDSDRVDIAGAIAVGILQSNEAVDQYLEGLGGLSSLAQVCAIGVVPLDIAAKEFGEQTEVCFGEEAHPADE
jgi:hypothetical protein